MRAMDYSPRPCAGPCGRGTPGLVPDIVVAVVDIVRRGPAGAAGGPGGCACPRAGGCALSLSGLANAVSNAFLSLDFEYASSGATMPSLTMRISSASIVCMPWSFDVDTTDGIWNVLPLRIRFEIASLAIITSEHS